MEDKDLNGPLSPFGPCLPPDVRKKLEHALAEFWDAQLDSYLAIMLVEKLLGLGSVGRPDPLQLEDEEEEC